MGFQPSHEEPMDEIKQRILNQSKPGTGNIIVTDNLSSASSISVSHHNPDFGGTREGNFMSPNFQY